MTTFVGTGVYPVVTTVLPLGGAAAQAQQQQAMIPTTQAIRPTKDNILTTTTTMNLWNWKRGKPYDCAEMYQFLHSFQLLIFVMCTTRILEVFTAFVVFRLIGRWWARPIAAAHLCLTCTAHKQMKLNIHSSDSLSLYQRRARQRCSRKSTPGHTSSLFTRQDVRAAWERLTRDLKIFHLVISKIFIRCHLEMSKQIDFSFLLISRYACTKERNKWSSGAHHWCSQLQDAIISVAVSP